MSFSPFLFPKQIPLDNQLFLRLQLCHIFIKDCLKMNYSSDSSSCDGLEDTSANRSKHIVKQTSKKNEEKFICRLFPFFTFSLFLLSLYETGQLKGKVPMNNNF